MRWLTAPTTRLTGEPVPEAVACAPAPRFDDRPDPAPIAEPKPRAGGREAEPARPGTDQIRPTDGTTPPVIPLDRGRALRLRHVDRVYARRGRGLEAGAPSAYHRPMTTTTTDRLPFTGNATPTGSSSADPLALLIGFVLDQQVPLQKAFSGPLELIHRIGGLDAKRMATMDPATLETTFRSAAGPPSLPEQHGPQGPGPVRVPRRAVRRRRVADLGRGHRRQGPPRPAARPARVRADEGREPSSRSSASGSTSRRLAGRRTCRIT